MSTALAYTLLGLSVAFLVFGFALLVMARRELTKAEALSLEAKVEKERLRKSVLAFDQLLDSFEDTVGLSNTSLQLYLQNTPALIEELEQVANEGDGCE